MGTSAKSPGFPYKVLRQMFAWALKLTVAVAALATSGAAILLFLMWQEHNRNTALPTPTGPFFVGRTTYAWTNEAQVDELSARSGSKRQLFVWIWYPAAPPSPDVPAEYLPGPWRAAERSRLGVFLRSFVKRDPAVVRVHSAANAVVSPERGTYPIVVLRPGGSALTVDFTTLAEDLASHGYFVVGFDAANRSHVFVLPDGQVIPRSPSANVENANGNLADPLIGKLLTMWTSDTRYVVDQLCQLNNDPSGKFKARFDLQRVGIAGHSFGGATALEFCHKDARCKAAIDMDGIPFGSVVGQGLGKPGMFLLSDHSREMANPESHIVLAEIRSIYDRLPQGSLYVVLRRANHFSFSDQILLNSQIALDYAPIRNWRIGWTPRSRHYC